MGKCILINIAPLRDLYDNTYCGLVTFL